MLSLTSLKSPKRHGSRTESMADLNRHADQIGRPSESKSQHPSLETHIIGKNPDHGQVQANQITMESGISFKEERVEV